MIITLTNESGCSFTYNDIPKVNTPKEMKDHLWSDPSVNFLFKSREELDSDWQVEIKENK
jgi:hypothetical protein